MQVSKKTGLPTSRSLVWRCALAAICFGHFGIAIASTNNPIRRVNTPADFSVLSNPRFAPMVDAALAGLEGNAFLATNAELVAWSVKTDQLGTPPRLFEDAVVLAHVVVSGGTNKWILAYIRSMPTGGLRGPEWQRLYYPPLVKAPVLSLSEFSRNPTDQDIADFIRASDFGYNSFDPREKVLDVVVYRDRKKILQTIQESIPPAEKQKRYFEDQRCSLENIEPPKR